MSIGTGYEQLGELAQHKPSKADLRRIIPFIPLMNEIKAMNAKSTQQTNPNKDINS